MFKYNKILQYIIHGLTDVHLSEPSRKRPFNSHVCVIGSDYYYYYYYYYKNQKVN
jgi:hypothetical protein